MRSFEIVAYHSDAPAGSIQWLEVMARADGEIVVSKMRDGAEASPLKDVLQQRRDQRLILNFRGYRSGIVENFIRAIDSAQHGGQFLIQSPEDGFLKDVRAARPNWLFGTSIAQVTRLIMLASLGLETIAPIRGDVIIVENDSRERFLSRLSERVINEAHRRKLKVLAGPANVDGQETMQLRARGVDGIMTTEPAGFLGP